MQDTLVTPWDPYHKKLHLTVYWAWLLFWTCHIGKHKMHNTTSFPKGKSVIRYFCCQYFRQNPSWSRIFPQPLRCSVTLQRPGALREMLMSHPLTDIIRAQKWPANVMMFISSNVIIKMLKIPNSLRSLNSQVFSVDVRTKKIHEPHNYLTWLLPEKAGA